MNGLIHKFNKIRIFALIIRKSLVIFAILSISLVALASDIDQSKQSQAIAAVKQPLKNIVVAATKRNQPQASSKSSQIGKKSSTKKSQSAPSSVKQQTAGNQSTSAEDKQSSPNTLSETILDIAKTIASKPYSPDHIAEDDVLHSLSYDQYHEIKNRPDKTIWGTEKVPFRLELLPAGFLYKTPVTVSVVENGITKGLVGSPDMFDLGESVKKALSGRILPLSGFRLLSQINSPSAWDEFMVFQGASYFQAIQAGGAYGLSSRGLAINTADPKGEEFPEFRRFWIERPDAKSSSITVWALLDSPSVTGAYCFTIIPGKETVTKVDLALFPRKELDNVGIAPLTSMFLFDESQKSRVDDLRPEVHDSDGLQITEASGEKIWRQLKNPYSLQASSFTTMAPKGFGLVQRSRKSTDYYDLNAHYEHRPSAWIEPIGDWGQGKVILIEIPSNKETNNNIITFWRPDNKLTPDKSWHFSYKIHWGVPPKEKHPLGEVMSTRIGPSSNGKDQTFLISYKGVVDPLEKLQINISTSKGKILNPIIETDAEANETRVRFELDPEKSNLAELRLCLQKEGKPVTETWLYRWTSN
jgi:glucans biosynthesis protein